MTQAERSVYEEVEDYIASTWAKSSQDLRNAVGFVLTSYRMRMSSSFHALRCTLHKRLDGLERGGGLDLEEDAAHLDIGRDEPLAADEAAELAQRAAVVEERDRIREIIGRLGRLSTDSKTKILVEHLQQAFRDGFTSAIVFSQYEDTIEHDVYFALSARIHLFQGLVGKLQPILARLPGEFERAALTGSQQRERARHELQRDVNDLVDRAEREGFDIDAVSEADFVLPEFPEPPFRVEQLSAVLDDGRLLPPGTECRALDPDTFALRLPGQVEEARATASPKVFDEHSESHQLVLAGGEIFERICSLAGVPADPTAATGLERL